jgi:hypothetical protein
MLRIPHGPYNRRTDGGKVVSPETLFVCVWYSLLLQTEQAPWPTALERIRKLIKITQLIGFRTRDFPACSIAPWPVRYRVPQTLQAR